MSASSTPTPNPLPPPSAAMDNVYEIATALHIAPTDASAVQALVQAIKAVSPDQWIGIDLHQFAIQRFDSERADFQGQHPVTWLVHSDHRFRKHCATLVEAEILAIDVDTAVATFTPEAIAKLCPPANSGPSAR